MIKARGQTESMIILDDFAFTESFLHHQGGGCGHLVYDEWNGDYDCDIGSSLSCEECKYGMGKKDPEAKCNQG